MLAAVLEAYGEPLRIESRPRPDPAPHGVVVDVGDGPEPVLYRPFGHDLLDSAPPAVTEDVCVRALGWRAAGVTPVWRILGARPLPFTLLAVTTEMKVND